MQIGHIQYLSTLIKSDRKYFRKKFGVQYFLDVIRAHYCTHENLSPVDCKTIRVALLGEEKGGGKFQTSEFPTTVARHLRVNIFMILKAYTM